jgi:DNA-binding transcriptional MerR regulator
VSASRRGLSIGQVLARLRPDFPDVSISKIRFLEAQELVTPERSASGYRLFSESEVDRLRYILVAQRDRFWPLKVIREALDAMDRGLAPVGGPDDARPTVPPTAPDPELPTPAQLVARTSLRVTERELRSATGLDEATLGALRTFGLLRPDQAGHYDEPALAVAHAAAALAAYGIEARHLRQFRTAADREVGLVEQVTGRSRPGVARSAGADPTADIVHHCLALHVALVKAAIAR